LSIDRKSEIATNLATVTERIAAAAKKVNRSPSDIKLIAVTKTFPITDLQFLYELGVRDFGENRDQEASQKVSATAIRYQLAFSRAKFRVIN
jgi:PLP dependent protein